MGWQRDRGAAGTVAWTRDPVVAEQRQGSPADRLERGLYGLRCGPGGGLCDHPSRRRMPGLLNSCDSDAVSRINRMVYLGRARVRPFFLFFPLKIEKQSHRGERGERREKQKREKENSHSSYIRGRFRYNDEPPEPPLRVSVISSQQPTGLNPGRYFSHVNRSNQSTDR